MSSATDQAVTEVLLEFLEALVHEILFARDIYRAELFERQRLYGVAVKRARHPDLCEYIHDVVTSLQAPLERGTLAKLAVVVLDPDRAAVERYVVEPNLLRGHGGGGGRAGGAAAAAPHAPPALDLAELQAQLCGCLLKLQFAGSYLRPPPPGCTFELVAYSAGRAGMASDAWVEEDGGGGHMATLPQLELTAASAEVFPLKSCRVEGAFALQLYVEGVAPS